MKRKSRLSYGISILILSLTADAAWAQSVPATDDVMQLDEIVVTARKRARAESLQETPISATAFGPAQMEDFLVKDIVDVGRLAPSVALQPSAQKGVQNFAIRGMGVSGSTPSDEPAVGIFQDGVYWGSNYGALGDLFDVESLEILRGPQGTLFGRNVTGGAVAFRSARPSFTDSTKATVGIGTYGSYEASAVLNRPLVEDKLAARLAVQSRWLDGYFTDARTNSDYGKSHSMILRPSLRFTPNDNLDVTLIGEWYSEKGDPVVARGVSPSTLPGSPMTLPQREGYITPADFWTVAPDTRGSNDIDVLFGVLEINWTLGAGVLTSVTGYRDVRTRVLTDFDGTPSRAFLQGIAQDQDQFSSELRYAMPLSDSFDFTTGLYYFEQSFNFREGRNLNNGAQRVATRSLLDNDSFAAFAEADWRPLEKLTLTVGARYTEETKKARSAPFGACALDFSTCTLSPQAQTDDSNLSPKLGLSYQVTDDQLLFASATRGFRSGGFSLRGTAIIEPYKAEQVTAYEVGYKADLLNRHLRLNLSAYNNDYKDLQRTVLGVSPTLGVVQSVFNAADATIRGVEVEATAILTEHLSVSGSYGYTDAKYKSFAGVADPGSRQFVRVPKDSFNLTATYGRTLSDGGAFKANLSSSYTGAYFFDDPNLLKQKSYNLMDANLNYTTPSGVWTVSAYGKNLTKEKYAFWGSTLGALGQNMFPGAPRTWGLRLTAEY